MSEQIIVPSNQSPLPKWLKSRVLEDKDGTVSVSYHLVEREGLNKNEKKAVKKFRESILQTEESKAAAFDWNSISCTELGSAPAQETTALHRLISGCGRSYWGLKKRLPTSGGFVFPDKSYSSYIVTAIRWNVTGLVVANIKVQSQVDEVTTKLGGDSMSETEMSLSKPVNSQSEDTWKAVDLIRNHLLSRIRGRAYSLMISASELVLDWTIKSEEESKIAIIQDGIAKDKKKCEHSKRMEAASAEELEDWAKNNGIEFTTMVQDLTPDKVISLSQTATTLDTLISLIRESIGSEIKGLPVGSSNEDQKTTSNKGKDVDHRMSEKAVGSQPAVPNTQFRAEAPEFKMSVQSPSQSSPALPRQSDVVRSLQSLVPPGSGRPTSSSLDGGPSSQPGPRFVHQWDNGQWDIRDPHDRMPSLGYLYSATTEDKSTNNWVSEFIAKHADNFGGWDLSKLRGFGGGESGSGGAAREEDSRSKEQKSQSDED